MNGRIWSLGASILVVVVAMAFAPQSGQKEKAVPKEGQAPGQVDDKKKPEYVGSNKCKKCHFKQHKSWKKTAMAQAHEVLKPGQASDAKSKAKLDPGKDYTGDETCLKCHAAGYGQAGGYTIPPADDPEAQKNAKKLEGVGCESCHGAGSKYIEVFEEIQKSERKYKVDELYAVGLEKIDASTCANCHNDKSPTYDAAHPLDFEKEKGAEGVHKHFPLKQREK